MTDLAKLRPANRARIEAMKERLLASETYRDNQATWRREYFVGDKLVASVCLSALQGVRGFEEALYDKYRGLTAFEPSQE